MVDEAKEQRQLLKFRGGQILLGLTALSVILFYGQVIYLFEVYDHVLDKQAFRLLMSLKWLPARMAHDSVMAVGFLFLGLALVIIPAALGVRRSWVAVGIIVLMSNVSWWYAVEREVSVSLGRSMVDSFKFSASSTYIGNSLGAFIGAFIGETLVSKKLAPRNPK